MIKLFRIFWQAFTRMNSPRYRAKRLLLCSLHQWPWVEVQGRSYTLHYKGAPKLHDFANVSKQADRL